MKNYQRLTAVLLIALPGVAQAAVVANLDAVWPVAPAVETVDVYGVIAGAPDGTGVSNYSLSGTRRGRQTFQVTEAFVLSDIYLSSRRWDGTIGFTVRFFEVADIQAGTWTPGNAVGSVLTFDPTGDALNHTERRNLHLRLSEGEQFLLSPRASGNQGYGIEFETIGDTTTVFQLVHAYDGTNYAPGRMYQDATGMNVAWDVGLALVAVPEPSRVALALGAALLLAAVVRRGRSHRS